MDIRRHAVGGKTHAVGGVKVVDGLDQPDTADLEQVIDVLAPAGEAVDDGQHQTQIALNEPLPRLTVAVPGACEQFLRLVVFQHRELRGVYAAYLYLTLHEENLLSDTVVVFPRKGDLILRRRLVIYASIGYNGREQNE